VESIAFSPDSTLLAIRTPDAIQLWDTRTGESCGNFEGDFEKGPRRTRTVVFSPDGNLIAANGYPVDPDSKSSAPRSCLAHVWNVRSGGLYKTFESYFGSALASSPSGELLASGDSGCTIKLWDVRTLGLLSILQFPLGDSSEEYCLDSTAFSPDSRLFSSLYRHSWPLNVDVCVWNLCDFPTSNINSDGKDSTKLSSDQNSICTSTSGSNCVRTSRVINQVLLKFPNSLSRSSNIITFSPGEKLLVCCVIGAVAIEL
jgi:WD40 repeat protein